MYASIILGLRNCIVGNTARENVSTEKIQACTAGMPSIWCYQYAWVKKLTHLSYSRFAIIFSAVIHMNRCNFLHMRSRLVNQLRPLSVPKCLFLGPSLTFPKSSMALRQPMNTAEVQQTRSFSIIPIAHISPELYAQETHDVFASIVVRNEHFKRFMPKFKFYRSAISLIPAFPFYKAFFLFHYRTALKLKISTVLLKTMLISP